MLLPEQIERKGSGEGGGGDAAVKKIQQLHGGSGGWRVASDEHGQAIIPLAVLQFCGRMSASAQFLESRGACALLSGTLHVVARKTASQTHWERVKVVVLWS